MLGNAPVTGLTMEMASEEKKEGKNVGNGNVVVLDW